MGSEPEHWGHCDTCARQMDWFGHPLVYRARLGEFRFRFCSPECKRAFQNYVNDYWEKPLTPAFRYIDES